MRLPLSVYRSRIGVQWADPSVRPSCVVTPRYSRWFMDGRSAPLSRPRKGWDSKMYPQTLSRHESERATLELFRPWRGGQGGVCNAPLRIRQEERTILWLSRPWRVGLWGVCNTPLRIRQEERLPLQLSHPQKGWDSKMYPLTLSRHESGRATLGLFRPWRVGLWGVCNTPLPCWKEERVTLWLSRSWRGGRGADIFATCPYSFLVTITPRLTFHF